MTEPTTCMTLQEYVTAPQYQGRIDRRRGVISGVKILGLTSRNNRRYPVETLEAAVPLYQNAKVNLNHPEHNPAEPRRYQDRFGLVRNVRVVAGEGMFADFHFNPKHQYAEQLLWDAENAPENVGFSHNIEAEVVQESNAMLVRKILAVRSVDLVADPATTQGLFESCEKGSCKSGLQNTFARAANDEIKPRLALAEQFCRKLVGLLVKKESLPCEVFSDAFVQSIFESDATPMLEKMLAERMRLAETLLGITAGTTATPVSREQSQITKDNRSFVEAIVS